jgi:hypothetical protein
MAKETMYRQCNLQKQEGNATINRTLWGPEKYTTLGRVVKVEEDNGKWTEGWTVVDVYNPALPEKYVVHQSHAYTRQRRASDI